MQQDCSKSKQLLSVVLVPLQVGHPMSLAVQVMDQQAGKLHSLVRRALEEEPAALQDLMSRLEGMGLLSEEAKGEMDLWPRIQIIADNPELMMYLRIETQEKEPTEVPGARELLETMTMYQWMEALEQEVNPR